MLIHTWYYQVHIFNCLFTQKAKQLITCLTVDLLGFHAEIFLLFIENSPKKENISSERQICGGKLDFCVSNQEQSNNMNDFSSEGSTSGATDVCNDCTIYQCKDITTFIFRSIFCQKHAINRFKFKSIEFLIVEWIRL